MATKAPELLPDQHPEQAQVMCVLSDLLCNRYLRRDTMNDLDKAIQLSRTAVDAMPDGHPSKPACLDRLAIQSNHRSSNTGSNARFRVDLEESIQL